MRRNKNNKRIFIIEKIEKRLKNIYKQKLEKTSIKNKNKNNQFKIINKIKNQKSNNYKVFLELKDKTIQKIITRILETIYKFYFFEPSFIFYPAFRTAELFNYIRLRLFLVKEIVEKPYSIVNTIQFCNILNKKAQNNKLTILIYQQLKHEVLKYYQFSQSNLEIYQETNTLSIFTNIYFNEFDNWVKYKIHTLNQSLIYQKNKIYNQLLYQVKKEIKQPKRLDRILKKHRISQKDLVKFRRKEKSANFCKQQVNYFRSFSNYIIGMKGKEFLNIILKIEINHVLIIHLKQQVNFIKATPLRYKKVNFIGYYVYFLNNQKINYCMQYNKRVYHLGNLKIKCSIPISFMSQNIGKKNCIKELNYNYKLFSKIHYMEFENILILKYFAKIWRGLLNYYSDHKKFYIIEPVHCNLYLSFIETFLVYTYDLNIKTVLVKHGKMLKIFKNDITINFPYKILET